MDPLYEPRVEDWARRVLAKRLGLSMRNVRKNEQWHRIINCLANKLDHLDDLQNNGLRGAGDES